MPCGSGLCSYTGKHESESRILPPATEIPLTWSGSSVTFALASLESGSLSSSSLVSPQQFMAPRHILASFSSAERIREAVDAHCYSDEYYLQWFLSVVCKLPFLSSRTYSLLKNLLVRGT